jgi:hypothetical protein
MKMKILSTLALPFLAFSLDLQAPEPVPLAHGNMPGELHHHLKIENEYVRVYYVEVPPHENTQLHQHDHDYLFVTLGDSDVINAIRDKPEVHLVLKGGETHFTRGGFAHVARNLSDAPFRNVTIELLKPQGKPRNLCEKVVDGPVLKCPTENKDWPADSPLRRLSKVGMIPRRVFETDKIEVSSYSPSLAGTYSQDSHGSRLLVAEVGPRAHVEVEGEAEHSLESGESLWIEAGKDWRIVLPKESKPTRFLMIRFKDPDAAAKP